VIFLYERVLDELRQLQDEKYRTFNLKLIPNISSTEFEILGVRIPKLRAIAKRIIASADWRTFLAEYDDSTVYECVMLCGMVTAGANCDFEEKLSNIKHFIPRINSWAICDTFCSDLKDTRKHPTEMYTFIENCLKTHKEYGLRFGVVMLMDYYIKDEYIDNVLAWYGKINSDYYYVRMSVAWGISACFVSFRDKTLEFLKTAELDCDTFGKTVQKIRESYRVSDEDKEMLRQMWIQVRK
jgi:3-methyladenine DNA glycosylase AlkD